MNVLVGKGQRRLVENMTPTERSARAWLQRVGYSDEDITFRYGLSPDFATGDGLGWEVKRLSSPRTALFSLYQVALFSLHPDTRIVFMREGEAEPVAVGLFGEMQCPGEWHELLLRVVHQPRHAQPFRVNSTTRVQEWVAMAINSGDVLAFTGDISSRDWQPDKPVAA